LFEEISVVESVISTGVKGLDALIENGLPFKSIIHIYGESGTGKSTLVIQCARNCVLKGWKVLFLDNERTCSSERLKKICETKFAEIAESIFVYEPSSFKNQAETIDNLEKYISDKTKMIIIDTLTTQYRQTITQKREKNVLLNRELNRQMAILKNLAIQFDLIVLITNQVRASLKGGKIRNEIEPVAAAILNYWADYEIKLGYLPDRQIGRRTATIVRPPTDLKKSPIEFSLMDEGLRDTK
jgi:RecA/RadA recombinase